jgi:hypothetical protein
MINIIFRNNTMIRILDIELLNGILILIILMIKCLLKKLIVCLDNFSALFRVPWVEQVWKSPIEIKNAYSYSSTSPYVLLEFCLIKHGVNFIFSLPDGGGPQ